MSFHRWHVWLLIVGLLLLGVSLAIYRHRVLAVPFDPAYQLDGWTIDARLSFTAIAKHPVKASFRIPYHPPGFVILDEFFVGNNYGVTVNVDGGEREVVWSKRRASGQQSLYYRAVIQKTPLQIPQLLPQTTMVNATISEAQRSAVGVLTELARKVSADVQTFAQETVKLLHSKQDNVRILLRNDRSNSGIVQAAVMILRQAHIKAIPVNGLELATNKSYLLDSCLLIWVDDRPVFINASNGDPHLPSNFLVWTYGSPPLFELMGGHRPSFRFAVTPTSASALDSAKYHGTRVGSMLMRFSMLHLPLSLQQIYRVLFTIPVGALVMLVLRQYVGLQTFGTFMPVLIALAFRQTQLLWGVVFFALTVMVGLLVRFYLNQLRLLSVPRMASILTVVVMLMAMTSVISQQLGLESGLSVALFPMVIITMVIERMCVMWDERGSAKALMSGVGSLLAAGICFVVMSQSWLQYVLLAFPEILLVVLSLIMALGQYRGYRLLEYWRFSGLMGD